jgi:hypothetical protein
MKISGPRNNLHPLSLFTLLIALLFANAATAFGQAATSATEPKGGTAAAPPAFTVTADPAKYLADVRTLAAPNMEGRGAGTKGIDRAANFLAKRYKALGLQPAGTKGYFQPFSVITGAKISGTNVLTENLSGVRKDLKLNEDYVPFSFSSPGEAGGSGVVFAGYGITAPEYSYDDYAGIDVKDKVVVILRYEPSGFAAKAGGQGMTHYSQLVSKAINARNHGAKALVVVNGKLSLTGEEDLLTRFGSVSGPENVGIVMLQVKNAVAEEWFRAAGKSLAETQTAIDAATKPASFAFPDTVKVGVTVGVTVTRATVNNVLAYLPGQSDEYVIIGAHYDHLGYGNFDSLAPSQIGKIHPGADDNASGTAGVLALAAALAPHRKELKRGILFMSFAGEELGLLGSANWVAHPTRPIDKAVAMLNMDMIGRIKDGMVYVGGVGTGSTLAADVTAAENATHTGLKFETSASGYSSSDHTSFVAAKIPVLFFFSGLHSDYHKPSDTADKIDAADATKLLSVVGATAIEIDDDAARPQFAVVAEPHTGTSSGGGGYGPYFGSIPDFGEIPDGVKFSDVKPGSPAAKAGFRAGDVLVKFGEKPIHNLYDFTDALRASKVGDTVDVTVLRDGKPITAPVKLEQRR